jgi:predicted site-specific integrase-resolvase
MYSITKFAKMCGLSSKTLYRWEDDGTLKPIVLKSGHRRYTDEHYRQIVGKTSKPRLNVIYCRESTQQQSNSLKEQERRIKDFCIARGITIDKVISEFGSALNYKRKGLIELLALIKNDDVETLVVHYKDRLLRFGFELFEELSVMNNFKIIIIDDSETNKTKEQEFAEDLISIVHHFSMKLYGSRNYKKKISASIKNLEEIKDEISKG